MSAGWAVRAGKAEDRVPACLPVFRGDAGSRQDLVGGAGGLAEVTAGHGDASVAQSVPCVEGCSLPALSWAQCPPSMSERVFSGCT